MAHRSSGLCLEKTRRSKSIFGLIFSWFLSKETLYNCLSILDCPLWNCCAAHWICNYFCVSYLSSTWMLRKLTIRTVFLSAWIGGFTTRIWALREVEYELIFKIGYFIFYQRKSFQHKLVKIENFTVQFEWLSFR